MSLLFSGSLLAQMIGFGALYFLGRLYAPEDFGELETILKMAGVFVAIAGLRYEMAIVVENSQQQSNDILRLSLVLNIITSVILLTLVGLFKHGIATFFSLRNANLLYALPLIVWLTSSTESVILWRNRSKAYPKISANRILFSTSGTMYKLSHPWFNGFGNGLFQGQLIGQSIALINIAYRLPVNLFQTTLSNLTAVAKRYKSFALFSSPAALLNILATSMPVFVISAFDGQEATGYFSNAYKLTYLPMSMLAMATGQVFFERIARIKNQKEEAGEMAHQLFNTLYILGIIPVIVMLTCGDVVAPLLLGDQWVESGVYIQLTILFYFSMYLTSAFSSAFETYQKLSVQLIYNLVFLISTFIALYLGYVWGGNTQTALLWFTGVGVVLRLVVLNYFFVLFGKNLVAKTIFVVLLTSFLAVVGFYLKSLLS